MPSSSVMALPPVRIAMSSSMAFRRSPKPGAFTAAACRVPRSLFTTRVASASPSTSSAMMRIGLPDCATCSSSGQHVLHHAELLLVDEDEAVLEDGFHALRVGHEVGREVPAVELHPLDDVEGGLHRLGFLDGDDAVLADLLHGLGDEVADGLVVVGGDGRDLGDLLLVLGRLRQLGQLLDDLLDRLVDAPLEPHRVGARGHVLEAARGRWPGRARSRWWSRHPRRPRSWTRPP